MEKTIESDFLKFLGTAGARFVMIKQLRASGGIWINSEGSNVLVDPGPGSLVRCSKSRPRLDPSRLSAIIVTHRHLDHSGDLNVMIEAMTEGGFKKRGKVFLPEDGLKEDNIILKYARGFPEEIITLAAETEYSAGNFRFRTSPPHVHPVQTYGIRFDINGKHISILSDTKYSPKLVDFYKESDILIMNVVFFQPRPEIEHLSLDDAANFIRQAQPKKVILTHFGMTMLKSRPDIQAQKVSQELGIEVIAATDGMKVIF